MIKYDKIQNIKKLEIKKNLQKQWKIEKIVKKNKTNTFCNSKPLHIPKFVEN